MHFLPPPAGVRYKGENMNISGEVITLLVLAVLAVISYRKWKGIDSYWPKLRRHGGDMDTFQSIEYIAMGVFFVSCYNVSYMLYDIVFGIPNAYILDIIINGFIFFALFLLARKAIKKHELRGRSPEVVQSIIGTFYLGFISAEFWLKHNAPQVLVRLLEKVL